MNRGGPDGPSARRFCRNSPTPVSLSPRSVHIFLGRLEVDPGVAGIAVAHHLLDERLMIQGRQAKVHLSQPPAKPVAEKVRVDLSSDTRL